MPFAGLSSRLNVGRLNAYRLNIGQTWAVVVTVNGVTVPKVQRYESWIEDAINAPQTCSLKIRGVTPLCGQSVTVAIDRATRFSGTITAIDQVETRVGTRIWYRIEATAGLPIVDQLVVTKTYVGSTANQILADLVASYVPSLTLNNVEAGLAWINAASSAVWTFDHEPFSQVLTAIANAVGASWKFFPGPDLWLRTTASNNLGAIQTLDTNNTGVNRFKRLTYRKSTEQVRTRVYAFGASGYAIPISLPPFTTIIPVANAYPFALGAGDTGQAMLSAPLGVGSAASETPITYSGTDRGGTVAAPTDAQLRLCQISAYSNVGSLQTGAYQWGFTYITSNGETPVSGLRLVGQGGSPNNLSAVLDLTGLYVNYTITGGGTGPAPPDPSITGIGVYRTTVNGTQLLKVATVTPTTLQWPSSYTDGADDSTLGAAPPSAGAVCPQGAGSTTVGGVGSGPGATSLSVTDGTKFLSGSGYAYSGQVLIHYTAVAFAGGGGNLIAATLTVDPLPASIQAGAAITATPVLTGCGSSQAVSPSAPTPVPGIGASGGVTIGSLYSWAVTFVSSHGESLPGALTGLYAKTAPAVPTGVSGGNSGSLTGPTNGGVYSYKAAYIDVHGMLSPIVGPSANFTSNGTAGSITVTGIPSGASVFVFRTAANGSTYFVVSSLNNAQTLSGTYTAQDITSDASLGTAMTAYWIQKYAIKALPLGPAGTTSRKVYRNTGAGTTAYKLAVTVADNTSTSVDDTVADGSLGAAAPTSDTSQLTGVPASPPSSTLGLFYQSDDSAAQSALAALLGGTGIQEHTVRDSTLASQTLVKARAQAELLLGKNIEERSTFTTEDQTAVAGANVPISISGISTTLQIQRARTSWRPGRRAPQIDVTAANLFTDLYGYMRLVETQAARVQ